MLQDAESSEVLFFGYANDEAIETSLRERIAVLLSTSRNELWRKGATSGDVLELAEIRVNASRTGALPGAPDDRRSMSHLVGFRVGPPFLLLPGHHR